MQEESKTGALVGSLSTAGEPWRTRGSFHARWIHLTHQDWSGLQWAGKSTGAQERRKESGVWTSNLFRKVVKESELSGWSLASQPEKGRQRQRGASGKMGACSLCPAKQRGLWHWHIPLLPSTEEMFVVTNLPLIIHVPGDFIFPVHEQFMRVPFNWILTRMEHAALEISSC